jgi:hypothetical protein
MTNLQEKGEWTIKCRLTIDDARKNPDAVLDSSGPLKSACGGFTETIEKT